MDPVPLVLAVVLLLAETATAGLYSNVLQNEGFETGSSTTVFPPWVQFANAYRYALGSDARSGTYAIAAWGNWWPEGEWNASGCYQNHDADDGSYWEASVWVKPSGVIQGEAYAVLSLEYLNDQTQSILIATSGKHVDGSTPTNIWTQLKVRSIRTRGAEFVRIKPMFVQSPAFEGGAVLFDDAALYTVETNSLEWAGYTWFVNEDYAPFPSPNYTSTNCTYVDTNGALHMLAQQVDGVWYTAWLTTTQSLGFGEYRWYLSKGVNHIDSNLVVGLFTYAQEAVFGTNQNEVDIEFSHAFDGLGSNSLYYTLQPWNIPGNGVYFPLQTITNETTTHLFEWRPDEIRWRSHYGHSEWPASTNEVIGEWTFRGRGIPIETNETCQMNIWFFFTNQPQSTQYLEVVIDDFIFTPFRGHVLTDPFDDGEMSNAWRLIDGPLPASVIETNDCLVLTPGETTNAVGYATVETTHRNERGEEFVFSALLNTVSVSQARSGEDMRALLSLSTDSNGVFVSDTAILLEGRYDADTDDMVVGFYTKTNLPSADANLVFEGILSNVTAYLQSGGIDWRLMLDPALYGISFLATDGSVVPITTNQGSAAGSPALSEPLQ